MTKVATDDAVTEATADAETEEDKALEKELLDDATSFDDFDDNDDSKASDDSTDEENQADEDTEDDADAEDSEDDTESDEGDSDTEDDSTDEENQADDTTADDTNDKKPKTDSAQEAFQKREEARKAKEQSKADAQRRFIDAGKSKQERDIRELQVSAYNNNIDSNTNKLNSGLNQAIAEIDLFKSKNPVVREAMLRAVDNFESRFVVKDENGDPIEVTGDVYQYLLNEAELTRQLTSVGAQKQKDDKTKQKNRTLTPPVKTPKKSKQDADLDAFDEEANRY